MSGEKEESPSGAPAVAPSSGHRSRKEKLVLRSFSTEHDEEMQLDFDEPKSHPKGRGGHAGRRASRTKRTVSAPEHSSPRRGSLQKDVAAAVEGPLGESSNLDESYERPPSSSSVNSPVPPSQGDGAQTESVAMESAPEESIDPKKLKKRKYTTSKGDKGDYFQPVVAVKTERKPYKARVRHSPETKYAPAKKPILNVFKANPIKISPLRKNFQTKGTFRVTPKKLTPPTIKLSKSSARGKAMSSGLKSSVVIPVSLNSKLSQVPVREQRKWLPRRQVSRNMVRNDDDLDPIIDRPIEPKSPESLKSSKTTESKSKSRKRDEEQELMQYTTGFSCLEELLDGRGKVILPELFLSMIQNLYDTMGGSKGRWGHLVDIFQRGLPDSNQSEIHQLLEENDKSLPSSSTKKRNDGSNNNGFQPLFRMEAVLDDKPSTSYPLVTEDELDAYETLVNLKEDFECWDDELESGNLFIDLIEMDLRTIRDDNRTKNTARIRQSDDKKGLKQIKVKAIPVNFSEFQNDHGLFIPEQEFKRRFLNKKEKVLQEMNTRSLRNGKKVELKNIRLESTIKVKVKRKRRRLAKIVHELPLANPNLIDKETMNLRSGKEVEFKPIDTAELMQPAIKLELVSEAMKASPVKSLQQDDYSRRVEADLRRLEAGEDLLFFDLNNQLPVSSSSQNAGRGTYIDNMNLRQVPVPSSSVSESMPSGSGVARALFGAGSSSSGSRPSTPQSQYCFKPIHPPPMSSRFSDTASMVNFNSEELKSPKETDMWGRPEFSSPFLPSDQLSELNKEQPFVRKPYSRHRHSKICPPFENNHCSFSEHFCSYPRAAGSRFCLQHVAEGATVNFERCKYVKGSRECGKFIPKAQCQSIFCDMHARAVAKARLKKMKPPKPLDPTPIYLRDINNDLERSEGDVLEADGNGYYRIRKHLFTEDNEAVNNSSDSDTDDEFVVDDYIKNQAECDSDLEDDYAPKLEYDLLKHAGYYSVTEVAHSYRSKLATLQKLYLRQLDMLKKKYVDSRKDFLRKTQAFRQLRTYVTTDPKFISHTEGEYAEEYLQHQIKTTQDTRAFLKHARLTGNRALLHMQMMKKRQLVLDSGKSRGRPRKNHHSETEKEMKSKEMEYFAKRSRKWKRARGQICCFGILGGDKCMEKAIPLAKFCRKHIATDKNQKLFTSCNCRFGPDAEDTCRITVFSELEKLGCPLHTLPIPVKDPPEDEKKPKVEEELDKLMEKLDTSASSKSSWDEEESDSDDDLVREMEDLVGDEVVDLDHFQEIVTYLQNKGLDLTDTEESDDTDEDEQDDKVLDHHGFQLEDIYRRD